MLQTWGYDNTFGDSSYLFGGDSNTDKSRLLFAPVQRMVAFTISLGVELNWLCIYSPNRMIFFE